MVVGAAGCCGGGCGGGASTGGGASVGGAKEANEASVVPPPPSPPRRSSLELTRIVCPSPRANRFGSSTGCSIVSLSPPCRSAVVLANWLSLRHLFSWSCSAEEKSNACDLSGKLSPTNTWFTSFPVFSSTEASLTTKFLLESAAGSTHAFLLPRGMGHAANSSPVCTFSNRTVASSPLAMIRTRPSKIRSATRHVPDACPVGPLCGMGIYSDTPDVIMSVYSTSSSA